MRLEVAIKEYEKAIETQSLSPIHLSKKATRIGLESMKWVKRYRPRNRVDNWSLLPGETEK